MKPMRDRNQAVVAIVGTLGALALILVSLNLDKLPFIHSTTTYHADFANADGLSSGDDVRVEGISVGEVTSVKVEGAHVDVAFTVRSGLALGGSSRASIEVATVLGNLFMQVESAGPGRLAPGATIPVSRTVVAYSLLEALDQAGEFTNRTDLPTLQKSLHTLAETVDGISSQDVKSALQGLATISSTLAAKQDDITSVLQSANTIVNTLNTHSGELVGLLVDGDQFLQLIESRHQLISQLLTDTAALGTQLSALFDRNGKQLSSLLTNLDSVTAVLRKEQGQLEQAIIALGQFSKNIANSTGSGPFLDLLTPTAVVPDNQIVGCGTHPATQKQPCSP